ncbi:hypothetical protein [Haloarcula laminariae]|uniref:hypothetical protein n=1 Tax=Haloarcula laminariae TaxID=2961577 RepID=UPI0021C56AEB|nr:MULTISPECIES: hypothetical protein [Halomicroarcula]
MSAVSYVTGLLARCIAAARSATGGTASGDGQSASDGRFATHSSGGDRDGGGPTRLLCGQALWMGVTLWLLFALSLLSEHLYFLVSFIGLLCNRVVFAPRDGPARWWRALNVVTWLCFGVLSYILYLRIRTSVPALA